ncbi:hypothetical protein JHK87_025103 [Glycine soja]|nr:hypothetical protein JHK87_025103 [Glycine soja]
MEEKSEGYNHYSTDGGGVTGVAGLTFAEGVETGCGLVSTNAGYVTEEAELAARKTNFEVEPQIQLKLVENEIEIQRWAWELKEVDLTQREKQLQEREHELEILLTTLVHFIKCS